MFYDVKHTNYNVERISYNVKHTDHIVERSNEVVLEA